MAGETTVHIIGNIVGAGNNHAIEVKRAGEGLVANFSIAVTPRRRNQQTGQWESDDKATVWFRCSAWGNLAQHIANNIPSGSRVIADGYFVANSYVKNGVTISTPVVNVTEIGPSLQFADVQVRPRQRGGNNYQQGNGGYQQQGGNNYQQSRGNAPAPQYQPQQNAPAPQQPAAPAGFTQPQGSESQGPVSPWDIPVGE